MSNFYLLEGVDIHDLFGLFTVRIISALVNPISDCDETYNYWEPTSFLLNNNGMQTWEYYNKYKLRSYIYILPQYYFGKILMYYGLNNIQIFYGIRIFLTIIMFICETYFLSGIYHWFGKRTTKYTLYFMTFSSGMFNCCSAYLPQSFVLCCMLMCYGSLYRNNYRLIILFMGIAGLIGWPFIGLLGLQLLIDLFVKYGVYNTIRDSVIIGGILVGLTVIVDYVYYKEIFFAPINIVLYNLSFMNDDNTGQNLYGTDNWKYYVKNLLFNFNIVFILALINVFCCDYIRLTFNCIKGLFRISKNISKQKRYKASNIYAYAYSNKLHHFHHTILPFWIWYIFFTIMPHKEERFLFVIYHLIALNGALSITHFIIPKIPYINDILNKMSWIFNFRRLITPIYIIISISRTYGQYKYYRGPIEIWTNIDNEIIKYNDYNNDSNIIPNICVGKEWYRIPTTLLVKYGKIRFYKSNFDGQLPGYFESTYNSTQKYNDKNREEPSRYIDSINNCQYIVDLIEINVNINEYNINNYDIILNEPFLDRNFTKFPFRSLYLGDKHTFYANYVLLRKKK